MRYQRRSTLVPQTVRAADKVIGYRSTATAGGYEEIYAELKRIGAIRLNETSYEVFSIGP
jgi:hypothetical protein